MEGLHQVQLQLDLANREKERLIELIGESSQDLVDHDHHEDHNQSKNRAYKKAAHAKKAANKHQTS